MRASLVILVLLMLAAAAGPAFPRDGSDIRFERWYRVERDGAPIGWMSMIERDESDRIATEAVYVERVLVFGEERRFETSGRVTESPDGEVLSRSLTIRDKDVQLGSTMGWPDDVIPDLAVALGPSAAARFIASRLRAGSRHCSVLRVDPLSPQRIEQLSLDDISRCRTTLHNREIEGFCAGWAPGLQLMLCARGYPISAQFTEGSHQFTFRATSKEAATAPFKPVESVEHDLVPVVKESGVPPNSRNSSIHVYRIDNLALVAPSPIGKYHYETADGGLVVTCRPGMIADSSPDELAAALRETQLINFNQIDAPNLGNSLGSIEKAHILEDLTRTRITKKNYQIRLGDGALAWSRREGDCTEHAVLLAALLRREGVPARVVGGLIAIEHDGRLHMTQHLWVQALIESDTGSAWEDLDSTLGPGAPEPVRIALGATGVTDESVEDLVRRLGSLAGLLRVEALAPE